jgi:hypothetical protein
MQLSIQVPYAAEETQLTTQHFTLIYVSDKIHKS